VAVPLADFRTDAALEGVALVRNTRLSVEGVLTVPPRSVVTVALTN